MRILSIAMILVATSFLMSCDKDSTEAEDQKHLEELYNEIQNLSTSETCLNSDTWRFTSIGAKACGGPQGYIAYSQNIDTTAFLQKVGVYTDTENAYNIKWGIISDCSLPPVPQSVDCENNLPVLRY